jgi:hypothetical protein
VATTVAAEVVEDSSRDSAVVLRRVSQASQARKDNNLVQTANSLGATLGLKPQAPPKHPRGMQGLVRSAVCRNLLDFDGCYLNFLSRYFCPDDRRLHLVSLFQVHTAELFVS